MSERPPFTPSPRPDPGAGSALSSAARVLLATAACFRRAGACPRLYTRADRRVWHWLCTPPGAPLQ